MRLLNEGYIKLDRRILDWEWYSDINTTRLFVHLLLRANWKEGRFQGREIERGSLVTSLGKLSEETGLSVREVRTALNHLKETHEVTSEGHSKYTVITIKNYCFYQDSDMISDKQPTSKRQTKDKQATTIEEVKKEKREEIKKRVPNGTPKETPDNIMRQYDFSQAMTAKIREWLKYKAERREAYKSTGLTALLKKISQKSGEYGENPVMALMDESMANGWRGIIWDRLEKGAESGADKWDKYIKNGLIV